MATTASVLPFPATSLGPFGGQSGDAWDDGTHTAIRKIEIATGDYVDSIRVEYDDGGKTILSEKHGGNGGNVSSVTLNYPDETIISISGYIDKNNRYLRSISFQTNTRKLGPFGTEVGESFSTPEYEAKIVGFWGRSGTYIDSIGAYMVPYPMYMYPPSVLGPYGGKEGDAWDDGTYTAIRQIEIAVGSEFVESLRVQYDKGGRPVWSEKHGGHRAANSPVRLVTLDYPSEFLISVSGYLDKGKGRYVRSLTFQTNLRKIGPYGHEDGVFFSTPDNDLKIIGFHGRSGWYIDAIGVYMVPVSMHSNVPYTPVSVGPFGGKEGNSWKDEGYTAIRQFEIATGDNVDSFRVQYDKAGRAVWSDRHGGDGGEKKSVKLNYPVECIISVSGYLDKGKGHYVRSLTFQTNLRKLGPYGHEDGEFFSTPNNDLQAIGFYGRSGSYMDSIGVYMVPFSGRWKVPYPPLSLGPFGGQSGNSWKNEGYTGIRQLEIATGDFVDSIRVQYDKAGHAVWSDKHGGDGGQKTLVTLNYPGEFVISISGYVDKRFHYIRSLTFQTNMRKLGPFGPEVGESFASPEYEGKIVGFFGASGTLTDSIGAYMEPIWE